MAAIRIGVLGAWRGMEYIRQFLALEETEVVAVCDQDEEKLKDKSPHFQRKLRKYVDQLRETRKLIVQKILEGKMTIGYGTDMVAVYECWECWREFHTWRLEGIPALRTLRAATSVNAKILEMEDQIGSIEPGKKADISAWHRDIINDVEAISECDFVMKDGIVYKEYKK